MTNIDFSFGYIFCKFCAFSNTVLLIVSFTFNGEEELFSRTSLRPNWNNLHDLFSTGLVKNKLTFFSCYRKEPWKHYKPHISNVCYMHLQLCMCMHSVSVTDSYLLTFLHITKTIIYLMIEICHFYM